MTAADRAFRERVELRYQLYNGLFLKLPFPPLDEVGIQLPIFAQACREGLEAGRSPQEIVEHFLQNTARLTDREEQLETLFLFLQLVERQVVLFDALEEGAYSALHPSGQPGSLSALEGHVNQLGLQATLREALTQQRLRLVLTAHPTQFYPESVLNIIQDLTDAVKQDDVQQIEELLLQMGRTSFRNAEAPTPLSEAESLLRSHADTFYQSMTDLQQHLEQYLGCELPPLFQLGFWPGGDRDGNPSVDSKTTIAVGQRLKLQAMRQHATQLHKLRRRLTFKGLLRSLKEIEEQLLYDHYDSAEAFLNDLASVKRQLVEEHQGLFVDQLDRLMCSVKLFGLHFAALDIRQDSRSHNETMARLLENSGYASRSAHSRLTMLQELFHGRRDEPDMRALDERLRDPIESLRAVRQIQKENGERGCCRYIISNTRCAADLLEVLLFARWAHCESIDVIPLFETVDDLQQAHDTMTELLSTPVYRQHLEGRQMRQTVMVGYSDGTKDGGYVTCNWEIFKAKQRIAEVAQEYGVEIVFFDGRGGPPARGGGKAHEFYRALGYMLPQSEIQLTVQGQTISSKFGTEEAAGYNLEQLLTAGLDHRIFRRAGETLSESDRELLQRLSDVSYAAYTQLKEHPSFVGYLSHITPLALFGQLNIASRPPKRKDASELSLDDLRAIPFVGSWAQMKQNVPGYFGLGSGLERLCEAGHEADLRELYQRSIYFRTLLSNASQALLKSNLKLTRYLEKDSEYAELWKLIAEETKRSEEYVLRISGQRELLEGEPLSRRSVALREELILPLLVIQQYALMARRQGGEEALEKLLLKSVPANVNASRNSA